MKLRKTLSFATAAACIAWFGHVVTPANASIVIGGTRVIYDANAPEVTVKLSNEGNAPALVQSWVDAGEIKSAPTDIKVPFTITPPIARIDPTKSQTLRVVYTGEPMPQDRESVFWLNVLEIPPKPSGTDADVNRIQLAFRSRIKLFYRPDHLAGTAGEAPEKLVWKLVKTEGKPAIESHNPTPFYVSLTEITVQSGKQRAVVDGGGMIGPGETHTFDLKGDVPNSTDARVHYTAINDYGGDATGELPVSAGITVPSQ